MHPNFLSGQEKKKLLGKSFSKKQARKYLINKGLHFDLNKKLFNDLLESGRLVSDRPFGRFSQYNLDRYYYETKPR